MKKLIIAVCFTIAACSPEIRVYSDRDPDYNLESYETFDWAIKANIEAGQNALYYNELNDKRIKSAVFEQLIIRGYQLSENKPDVFIHYHIIVDDQAILTPDAFGYYYGPYWMRLQTNVYPYREGTLIVDIMDSKTNHLVWRGWAVSAINTEYTSDQVDRLIKTAVSKIFRKFPLTATNSQEKDEIIVY